MKSYKRGQSTLEYAVLIVVAVGALLVMQIYMKRGVEGKLRQSADDIGGQFEAGNTSVNTNSSGNSMIVQTINNGVTQTNTTSAHTFSGNENVTGW